MASYKKQRFVRNFLIMENDFRFYEIKNNYVKFEGTNYHKVTEILELLELELLWLQM